MLNMIVAYSKTGGIGLNNKIPWKLSSDLKRFKFLTIGKKNNSVIMGRKTWESLKPRNKPLVNRTNIIISKTLIGETRNDIKIFKTIEDAIGFCNANNFDENWVIGGSEIYKEYLKRNIVDNLYITELDLDCKCDAFFPNSSDYEIIKNGNLVYVPDDNITLMRENDINFKYKILKMINSQNTDCP